jgi:hypothetical protein
MDKYDTLDGGVNEWRYSICPRCVYFRGKSERTCNAFPVGIPDKYIVSEGFNYCLQHKTKDDEQTGDFVFKFKEA